MRTDDLVAMLATGIEPVRPHATRHRLARALLVGAPLSLLAMLVGFGLRHDLAQVVTLPMFWVKLLFPISIAAASFLVVQRLARPGVRIGASWLGLAVPVACMGALAGLAWFDAPVEARLPLLLGATWRSCAASIALLALPMFVAALLALRGLAPTRPAVAGAMAGAWAGATGATVYALHCPELTAPFLAVWYVAGMALPALAGALLGPRLLRW
jgi:hypothetical protein